MEEFVSTVTILLIGVAIWAFSTWRKLKNAEKLKEFVTWSVCKSDSVRGNMPLWAHFNNAQNHAHIRDEYRITGDEWDSAKEIIKEYQQGLIESYFNGMLWPLKSKYGITSKDYFIFMLYVHLCKHEITGHNVVFHKMHYIAYMYCKASLALQGNVPAWNENRLKEILDDDLEKKPTTSYKIPVPGDPGVKVNYRGRP